MQTPWRFHSIADRTLVTNEVGEFRLFADDMPARFFGGKLSPDELAQLRQMSVLVEEGEEWRLASMMRRLRKRHNPGDKHLSYLIIIPTLRCDLSCSYCQVSRAPLTASGFDWTDEQIEQFSKFLDSVSSKHLKVEFQGGEPTLRADLLKRIMDICVNKFDSCEFVICSNLVQLSQAAIELIERDDVFVSTSIDGPDSVMTANRTGSSDRTTAFFSNFHSILNKHGPEKLSALPTITERMIGEPESLIDFYIGLGFESIFLRPVNYMGFARKTHGSLSNDFATWDRFYRRAIDYIVEVNRERYFEEFYLSLAVRTIFADMPHGFVDLRSPARFASDYCVIDFDGTLYPSDEARMLSRTRVIDLSIGSMKSGFDHPKLAELNRSAVNQTHPDCVHCAYLPYCGIDVVDEISRYARTDLPKHETWFCQRQMAIFDLIFEKVARQNRAYLDVFLKWIYRQKNPPPTYELFYP